MIMKPTAIERNLLTGPAAHNLFRQMVETDMVVSAALVKNLLYAVAGTERYVNTWNEEDLLNKETLIEYGNVLFNHIADEASRELSSVTFSSTEVAKYIGVTPQTINTWIREKKIIGVPEKEGKKWAKIPENAEVVFPNGKQISINVLKANWEKENQKPEVDEKTYLELSIKEMEEKYSGRTFEDVFGDKTIRELSEEDTDASIWMSYKVRLDNVTKTAQYT